MDGATGKLLLSELAKHRQVQDRDEDAGSISSRPFHPRIIRAGALQNSSAGFGEGTSTTQSVTSLRARRISRASRLQWTVGVVERSQWYAS